MSLSIGDVFDASFYRAANSDLASLNDAQALSHFQTFGLNEGRSFSPLIDLNFYRARSSDLRNFNNSQLLDHLRNYGVAEGRRFSLFFDPRYYSSISNDLSGLSNEQLFNHAKNNGIAEGRQASSFFDFNFYRANNSDLTGLNNNQLLQHFQVYGVNEGRKSSPFFDVGYYRASNPDLVAAGYRGIQLLYHFNGNGGYEGRPGASDYVGNTLSTARPLTLSPNLTYALEFVGSPDSSDYYRFDLSQASTVVIADFGYSRSVFEEVLDSRGQVLTSRNTAVTTFPDNNTIGNLVQSIPLAAGTYYVRIQPLEGNTNYALILRTA